MAQNKFEQQPRLSREEAFVRQIRLLEVRTFNPLKDYRDTREEIHCILVRDCLKMAMVPFKTGFNFGHDHINRYTDKIFLFVHQDLQALSRKKCY